MRYNRNYLIIRSRLAKAYLYPKDRLHCEYCGWYPGNGIWSYQARGQTCCEVEEFVRDPQTRLF